MDNWELVEAKVRNAIELIESLRKEKKELDDANNKLINEFKQKDENIKKLEHNIEMYKNSLAELDTLKAEKEKMKNRIEEILAQLEKVKL
ncbi:MAG: hypothetical protein AABY84_07775 [Candidatus Firestonebacteria bacterium]